MKPHISPNQSRHQYAIVGFYQVVNTLLYTGIPLFVGCICIHIWPEEEKERIKLVPYHEKAVAGAEGMSRVFHLI